jgi:hypothetical protein
MASVQLLASLPPLTLDAGCTVTVEAVNPTTGAAITGVTVSAVTIYADNATTVPTPVERAPLFALEPLE